jgi:uncharacterized RDD family membrane protein YckC
VLLSVGLFAVVTHWMIGLEALGSYSANFFGGLAVLFAIAYKLTWAFAGRDSAGLAWCHLKLLDFDGVRPSRRKRLERLGWSCISILPAGLGLIWALVDQEKLSWHDHSSQTFVTDRGDRSQGL